MKKSKRHHTRKRRPLRSKPLSKKQVDAYVASQLRLYWMLSTASALIRAYVPPTHAGGPYEIAE